MVALKTISKARISELSVYTGRKAINIKAYGQKNVSTRVDYLILCPVWFLSVWFLLESSVFVFVFVSVFVCFSVIVIVIL